MLVLIFMLAIAVGLELPSWVIFTGVVCLCIRIIADACKTLIQAAKN